MEIKIIQIGNSKGIRLSKTIMEKYNFEEELVIEMLDDGILIKPKNTSRLNWDKAFKQMHASKEDRLIVPDVLDEETFESW